MLAAVDLYSGAGGATQGLRNAGFDVVAAVENDPRAAETWRLNHPGQLIQSDIRDVDPLDLRVGRSKRIALLKSCPPCQGFSSLRVGRAADERQNDLVVDTLRFVDALEPQSIVIENVPGLRRDERFVRLIGDLQRRNYLVHSEVVNATAFGVPQRRRRLVIVAIDGALVSETSQVAGCLAPSVGGEEDLTAGRALNELLDRLPNNDPWHRWRASSPTVLRRIAAVPIGGNRFDLPTDLQLECHRRLQRAGGSARVATGSYGRILAGSPAPTMTTRCTTPACGSFIHPSENRGLSLREAAALQTFPHEYKWHGPYDSVERQIGNAVPVRMAEAIGGRVLAILTARRRPQPAVVDHLLERPAG